MTDAETGLICTVCEKHKANLRARKSKLMPDMPMLLCNDCIENKYEPRFAVVMVGRDLMQAKEPTEEQLAVRPFIRNNRYPGQKITAEELV